MKKIIFLLGFYFFCIAQLFAELRVYYIAVGQGDAQYIELPNGENVLIDGGPNSSNSLTNPLIYFLESKNIKKINHVILSHPHADHYAGLGPVFDRYEIKNYYDSFLMGSSAAQSFRNKATSETGISVINTMNYSTVSTFTWSTTPKVEAILLHRGDAFGISPPSANDVSLVFKIVFGSSTFFFGGDAGAGGSYKPLEGWLAGLDRGSDGQYAPFSPSFIQSDCYKVNHHGSASSSYDNFLSVLKPKYAFIGVGLGNRFGHPRPEVIERLKNIISQTNPGAEGGYYGSGIFSTDRDGHIMVKTFGDGTYQIEKNYFPTPVVVSTTTGDFVDLPPHSVGMPLGYVNIKNNLFNPVTESLSIQYHINKAGESRFSVYSISGELVYENTAINVARGLQSDWVWDGKNSEGETVAPGAYFIFVNTPDSKSIKKAAVIR